MNKLLIIGMSFFATISLANTGSIKVNIAILRNAHITHGPTCVVGNELTNIAYKDDRTYIEADIIEITEKQITLRCLISTCDDDNGMMNVRGMPRLIIPMSNGLGMASLNCNGKDEQFMLIISACPCK